MMYKSYTSPAIGKFDEISELFKARGAEVRERRDIRKQNQILSYQKHRIELERKRIKLAKKVEEQESEVEKLNKKISNTQNNYVKETERLLDREKELNSTLEKIMQSKNTAKLKRKYNVHFLNVIKVSVPDVIKNKPSSCPEGKLIWTHALNKERGSNECDFWTCSALKPK